MVTTIVALSTVLAAGVLLWWRHLDGVIDPGHESDSIDGVPAELRTAALILTDARHLSLMWPVLGLGSEGNWPNVLSAELIESGAVIDVQMVGGQKLSDWTNDETTDALAQYLGVPKVLVSQTSPGFLRVELRTFDTLAASVTAPGLASTGVDLEAVEVGVREDGRP